MRLISSLATLVVLTAASALSGCAGFQPLYAEHTAAGLSRIEVVVPDGRIAYLLRENLDDSLGRAVGQPPLYRMTVTVDERRYPRGVRPDDTATRYELQLNTSYQLREIASGAVIGGGAQGYTVTYDSADPPYAGVAGQQDGQVRAAMEVAQRIRTEVAVLLSRRPA